MLYLRTFKIYELDPEKSFLVHELTWQASFRKTKVKLDLLSDTDMLLMVENGITRGIYHSVYQHAKANKICMKDYDKNIELSYPQYWDVNKQKWLGNVSKASYK